jgi:hypothetical protein
MTTDDNTNDSNEDAIDNPAEARVDELARSAGTELRRPAPEQGFAGVQRARRNRQITRAAIGGTTVLAIVVGGFVALTNRDDRAQIGPVDSIVNTEPDTTTNPVIPEPEVTTRPRDTTEPVTTSESNTSVPRATLPPLSVSTSAPPSVGDAPSVVYTSAEPFPPIDGGTLTLVNPADGAVIGTEPIDVEKSRLAWEAFYGEDRSIVDLGDVTYDFTTPREEAGQLDPDLFPEVDLCMQNRVTVSSPSGSAMPERARLMRVSPDDRFVVTVSATCPEVGTLDADTFPTQVPYDLTVRVFDARQPELAGRVLAEIPSTDSPSNLTASSNGRFMAIETYGGNFPYRIFDLESATEVDLGLDVGADCIALPSTYGRFIGPWIGTSSVALIVDCLTAATLNVLDLTDPDNRLTVPYPEPTKGGFAVVAVDYDTYVSPQDAWFTMCDPTVLKCFIGHGTDALIELSDVAQASFVPLGFEPGD